MTDEDTDGEVPRDPLADVGADDGVDDPGDGTERDPDDNPFERIGEGSGPRHGDPFDAFERAEDPTERADDSTKRAEEPTGHAGDPVDESPTDRGAEPSRTGEGDRPDPARDGLPSGLAEGDAGTAGDAAGDPFTEFDEPTTDPFGEGDTVFDRAEGDDGVWERMESTDSSAAAVPGKRYVDVDKHSYCETCEHFSAPPEIACSNDGTEILEFVDMDTVRVVDCPVVAERKALEEDE